MQDKTKPARNNFVILNDTDRPLKDEVFNNIVILHLLELKRQDPETSSG